MKNMKNQILFSLILLLFVSCNKEDDNLLSSDTLRPKRLVFERTYNGNVSKDTSCVYYTGSHIDSITFSGGKTLVKYETNKITLSMFESGDKNPVYYSVYEYNALGKISKHTNYSISNSNITPPSYTIENLYVYEYNTDGTLKITDYIGGKSITNQYNILSFDIRGNLVQDDEYNLINDSFKLMHKVSYTYDNQYHYLKNVEIVPLSSNEYNTYVNNVVTETSEYFSFNINTGLTSTGKNETRYALEYNSAGFPVSIASTNSVTRIIY